MTRQEARAKYQDEAKREGWDTNCDVCGDKLEDPQNDEFDAFCEFCCCYYTFTAAKLAASQAKWAAAKALLVALALLLPAFASAQPRLTLPTTVYAGAAALDLWSTADCLSVGCHEHNPLIGWAEPHGTAPMLAVGVALEAAGYLALTHLIAPHHPRLATATIYGAALAHGFLGVRNLQQARGQRICNRQTWGTRC